MPQGLLVLMINPRSNGQVFLVNRHPPVKPGDVVHVVAQYAALKSHLGLVEDWRGIDATNELKLNCKQVGLLSYQILSTEKMADAVRAHCERKQLMSDMSKLTKQVSGCAKQGRC